MRRGVVLLVAVLMMTAAVPGPVAAGTLTPDSQPVEYTVDGDLQPSVVVHATDGDALRAWVNGSTDRRLVRSLSADRYVVAAPAWVTRDVSLLTRVLDGGLNGLRADPLSAESWVKTVAVNQQVALDRPDGLSASAFEPPRVGLLRVDDPALPTDGLAFSDEANRSLMADGRSSVDADQLGATGSGQTVAVIDTGANTANGRLFGNGTSGSSIRINNASRNTLTGASVDTSTGNYSVIADGNGHGTWVASAIAANTSSDWSDGVAPDATLLVLKALDDEGSGSTAAIVEAIRHAASQDADVISMSLGSPLYSEAMAAAVENATAQGSTVVIAAGNSRVERGANIASPADAPIDGTLTVGATTAEAPDQARSAYFSQVGPDPGSTDSSEGESLDATPDVAAPGMKVTARVATTGGGLQNSTLSGTSMATPVVSGTIAAAQASNSTLAGDNPAAVAQAVRATADPVPNAGTVEVGAGMADADALAAGTTPDQTQADTLTDAAAQRDAFYRAHADGSGRGLVTILS
jgi:subtilisin family serine protease